MLVPSSPSITSPSLPPLWNGTRNFTAQQPEPVAVFVPDTAAAAWSDDTFSIPEDDLGHAFRQRRNVLGRLGDMFGAWHSRPARLDAHAPAGHLSNEQALSRIGQILWEIRQGKAMRDGKARRIRLESLQELGGRKSPEGQEFDRRYKDIGRFVRRAGTVRDRILRNTSEEHAFVVTDEMNFAMGLAWRYLSNGQRVPERLFMEMNREIECRIKWLQKSWRPRYLYSIWARFVC